VIYWLHLLLFFTSPFILVALVAAFLVGTRTRSPGRATLVGGSAGAVVYGVFVTAAWVVTLLTSDGTVHSIDVENMVELVYVLAILSTVVLPLTFGTAWLGNLSRT
jgi:hypothetical protein